MSRSTNKRSSSPTFIARLFISKQSPSAQEESNSCLALSQLKLVFSSKERQVMESRSEFMPLTPTVQHPVGHADSIRVTCHNTTQAPETKSPRRHQANFNQSQGDLDNTPGEHRETVLRHTMLENCNGPQSTVSSFQGAPRCFPGVVRKKTLLGRCPPGNGYGQN